MNDQERTHTERARFGFFPLVAGDEVSLRQAGATVVFAGNNASFERAGANAALVGGDLSITQGGSNFLLAFGEASIQQGGTIFLAAKTVRAEQGFIGAVVAGRVELEDTSVLMSTTQAIAFGAALGVAVAVVGRLLRRG